MTLLHHPAPDLLLGHAAGTLARGPDLLVNAHLRACPVCRAGARRFEAVGGALLDALPPSEMAPDALARALASIERPQPPEPPERKAVPAGMDLESVLGDLKLGARLPLGPGLWMRRVLRDGPAVTYLLRSGPGRRLPMHSHTGMEYVCVLKGAFSDETGRYGPGDFAESDDTLVHSPVTDMSGECICLIAADGPMQMKSLLGRAMQAFVGL